MFKFVPFYQNQNTGAVRAVFKTSSTTDQYGNISDNYRLTGQDGNEYIPQNRLAGNWYKLNAETAEELWNNAVNELPEYRTSNLHLIGGTVLPVWDKLPIGNVLNIISGLLFVGTLLMGGLAIFKSDIYTWQPVIVLGIVAYLISPYGLPKLAEWLVIKLDDLNDLIKEI